MRPLVRLLPLLLVLLATPARAETLPDVLRRVAPKIVRIQFDDEPAGTGFIYPDARHVTTSYSVVNRGGQLWVFLSNGKVVAAKVVAWSEADDLAILALPGSSGEAALELETTPAYAGQEVVLLGLPNANGFDEEDRPPLTALPTPRFGKVSVVSPAKVAVDSRRWTGDDGAPILSAAGGVLGVVSGPRDQHLGVVSAVSAERVRAIAATMGWQGDFSPHPKADSGWFGGVFVAPVGPYRMVGGGLLSGYHYGFVALTLDLSFAEGSFIPMPAGRSVAYSQTAVNVYGTFDIEYMRRRKLCLGGGISLVGTTKEVRQDGANVELTPDEANQSNVAPMLVFQDVEGWLFFSASWMPTRSAGRLDIGVMFGR